MSYFAIKRPGTPQKEVKKNNKTESCKAIWDYGFHSVIYSFFFNFRKLIKQHIHLIILIKQRQSMILKSQDKNQEIICGFYVLMIQTSL